MVGYLANSKSIADTLYISKPTWQLTKYPSQVNITATLIIVVSIVIHTLGSTRLPYPFSLNPILQYQIVNMSSKGIVLVTGVNGFIAARTAEAFLKAGYSVRGTTRSESSTQGLKDALSEYADRLEIYEVPDITVEGAFDEAVKGVDAIAHLATPVSLRFTDPEPVLYTAINGVTQVLASALKEPKVKHFVQMSSVTAIFNSRENYVFTESDWNDLAEQTVAAKGKDSPSWMIYAASKTAAERAFWAFRDTHHPHFTMTAINPVFVGGPQLVLPATPDKLNETTSFVWDVFSGKPLDQVGLGPVFYGYVDVRDVARVVVFGVEHSEKTDGERFILSAVYAPPQAAADILRKAYPERRNIIQEGTPGQGYEKDFSFPSSRVYDGSKTVRVTGQNYIPWETTILDMAKGFERYL
jgi:nucleoside-diphosphate-sugar epimerase